MQGIGDGGSPPGCGDPGTSSPWRAGGRRPECRLGLVHRLRGRRRRSLLAASLLVLLPAVSQSDAALAAAPAASEPSWSTAPLTPSAPVWSNAPAEPVAAGWTPVAPRVGLPSTWQPGPADVAKPPASTITQVRGLARGFTVNGQPYPDISLKLPNAFAADPGFLFSGQLAGTSRTRSCRANDGGSWKDCADGEVFLELTPLRAANASLGLNWTIQSLSSRNTPLGSAQSLGFKGAINLTPTLGLAFGGEQVIQFDDQTDLGRNYYLLLSQAIPLSRAERPAVLVATAGIGSDFFGYGGNGTLGASNCLGGNNISSRNYPRGTDCYWGPVGALSVAFNDRVSVGMEWFGYGLGAGLSVRPFQGLPLTASVYAIDFLGSTPSYISETCSSDSCETRYYGRLTYSF
ncbi:MAG: hypothetical protein ACKOXO_12150 [Cyanobium sp.]